MLVGMSTPVTSPSKPGQRNRVPALTHSDEAVRQVLAEAKKQNVSIHTIVSSADDVDYGNDRFDLVYAIFENWVVTKYADKYVKALKPGGLMVIEGFHADISKKIGRPLGHGENELPRVFDRLRIVYYEDTIGPADWNEGKPSPIVRFIARKEQK
jgi:Methyltransferase domain